MDYLIIVIVWLTQLGNIKVNIQWAVVVAQLAERLLPIPEFRGSNPVIGKILK